MSGDRQAARAGRLAFRYLAARPRSRFELAGYLGKKGVPEDAAASTLEEMERLGYIDDRRFAFDYGRYLVESRGLSRYALKQELRKKGVADEDSAPAISELFSEGGYDEYEVALGIASKKADALSGLADRERARRRLTDHLRRRGFSFDVIHRVLTEAMRGRNTG